MAIVSKNSNIYSPYIYVDLLTDYGFKLAFGNREILLHFLNSLFEKDGIVFKSVRYLNKEQTQMHKSGRTIFYDVLCKIDGGADVIIEMQHQSQDTFGDRALYYMSNSIVKQGSNKNDWHYKMCPVYGIFIMNFHMIGDNIPENVVNEVSLTYDSNKEFFTNKFKMFFIDLLHFNKTEDELETNLDCWIYNIKNMGTMTAKPKMATQKEFGILYSRAEIAAMSPREYRKYEASLKAYRDALSVEATYRRQKRKAREEGLEEGRAEGREQGLIEGRAEGLEEGRAEGRAEGLEEGRAEGRAEGREQGRDMERVNSIRTIMQSLSLDFDAAAKVLQIPDDKIALYRGLVENR